MNILLINHNFDQDIDALLFAGRGHEFRIVAASYFGREARRYFPPSVSIGLEEYHRSIYAQARRDYAVRARELLHNLYGIFPFEVIISPSDTFYYIRAVVVAAQEMGVPFIVAQKETTISPYTMKVHSRRIGRLFPFIGDHMFVCSNHHKRFWMNAGTDPSKITVTGQPRFDFYFQPGRWHSWSRLGLRLLSDRKNILFFSYALHAYRPKEEFGPQPWAQLRNETEEALVNLVRRGDYNLLVKAHPSQNLDDVIGMAERLWMLNGSRQGIYILDATASSDTRQYIVNADIVVAFQTTALFESLIAGKDVIYTHWTKPVKQMTDSLMPFHERTDILHCARAPQELTDAILASQGDITDEEILSRRRFFSEYLGAVNGQATNRVLRGIENFMAQYRPANDRGAWSLQYELRRQAPSHCRRVLPRALIQALIWSLARWLVPLQYALWQTLHRFKLRVRPKRFLTYTGFRELIAVRQRWVLQRLADCWTGSRQSPMPRGNSTEPSRSEVG